MANGDDGSGDKKGAAFAQGVGFVVFSGIAVSLLKSLSSFNRHRNETQPHSITHSTQPILDITSLPPPPPPLDPIITKAQPLPLTELTQPIQDIPPPPPPPPPPLPLEPITQKPYMDQNVLESSSANKTVEIVRGDTLWGLSRKYGVSIDAIKQANELSGDTIQVGKKLIIP